MTDANGLLRLLGDIESAVIQLASAPAVREVGSHAVGRSVPRSRPPIDLGVLDALAEVRDTLRSRARLVWTEIDEQALTDDQLDPGPDNDSDLAVLRYLRARVSFVASRPWADEAETELRSLRALLQRQPGSPLWREVVERIDCTRCHVGVVAVRIVAAGDSVETTAQCGYCGWLPAEQALEEARIDQARHVDWMPAETVVTTLAARGMDVTAEQIRGFGDRKVIERRTFNGRRHYRAEDVANRVRRLRRLADQAAERHGCDSPATVRVSG